VFYRAEGKMPAARRAWLAVSVVTLLTVALPASGLAADRQPKPPSCHAGRTVFHRAGIRAFVVVRRFGHRHQEGSSYKTFYICSPALRTAHVFDQGAPFTSEDVYDYKLVGERLGFVYSSSGVQNGSAKGIGWVNLRSGRAKSGAIYESEDLTGGGEEDPGLPKMPSDRIDYVIAGDGTVAVLGEGDEPVEWEVALLHVKLRSLGRPRRLFTAKQGQEGLEVDSLAITATSVTWRTKSGQPGSASR
jgi:hypothetical protein